MLWSFTQLTHAANGEQAFMPDWSPDGTRIVFVASHRQPHSNLEVMDLRSGRITVIWQGPDGSREKGPVRGSGD